MRTEQTEALERLRPYLERARRFSGWDFSGLEVRKLEPGPTWDYPALVREHARDRYAVLDMGTGGGELLSKLRGGLPARVVATEEWVVNAPIAYRRLTSLGIHLIWCRSFQLPFSDASFDLVLNRHEELEPHEVARVLRPAGRIVTQQVGKENWRELRGCFPRMTDFGDLFGEYSRGFEAAGLDVTTRLQHIYRVAYQSLGDVVFMLAVTPWTVPGFDLERDLEALLALEAGCKTEDGLVLTESRFLIIAEKAVR